MMTWILLWIACILIIRSNYGRHFFLQKNEQFQSRDGVTVYIYCVFSLHPGDLYPFTRKPLFVIIDSDNSSAFEVSCI